MATWICPWCGKKVDKFIMFRGDVVGCRLCGIHTKQTNADRIRSMTDEELAVEMYAKGGCPHDCETLDDMDTDCVQCWLDWLKEEVTANDS